MYIAPKEFNSTLLYQKKNIKIMFEGALLCSLPDNKVQEIKFNGNHKSGNYQVSITSPILSIFLASSSVKANWYSKFPI